MALTTLLDEALEAWEYTRTGVIEEIENLSAADLSFRPHAESAWRCLGRKRGCGGGAGDDGHCCGAGYVVS